LKLQLTTESLRKVKYGLLPKTLEGRWDSSRKQFLIAMSPVIESPMKSVVETCIIWRIKTMGTNLGRQRPGLWW